MQNSGSEAHKHNCSVCNGENLPTSLQRDKNNSLIMNSKFLLPDKSSYGHSPYQLSCIEMKSE